MSVLTSGSVGLLKEARSRIGRADAEILLADILCVERAQLYIYEGPISDKIISIYEQYINKRMQGVPISYILGKSEFMGLEFRVTKDVLIPRSETELVAQEALKIAKTLKRPRILDLGLGSGNIAIFLTESLTDCTILGSDISKEAIMVAGENAGINRLDNRVKFIESDLFEALDGYVFDIVVSNPPYIATADLGALQREIGFEPALALDGGKDGLHFYRRIADEIRSFLADGAHIVLEIGCNQKVAVQDIFKKNGFSEISAVKDYSSLDRIVIARWIS